MGKSIDPAGYGFKLGKADWVMGSYDPFFAPLMGKGIKLLELGVQEGTSLRFWHDYFENATIIGLDSNPAHIDDSTDMIRVYQGYQQDVHLLDRIAQEQAPDGFDVIIDDCSHIGRYARISFWHLFENHLKPGGLYAIEDWGTGYFPWTEWPDGRRYREKSRLIYSRKDRLLDRCYQGLSRAFPHFPRLAWIPFRFSSTISSHQHGMVGFVKELLDACVLGQKAIPRSGGGRYVDYGISQLHIVKWVVIVVKSSQRFA